MGEVTRKSVLLECLEYERGLRKLCSLGHRGLVPAEGQEDLFFEQQAKCRVLQDLIQSLESESVRQAMADWQKEVMKNGPSALKMDLGYEAEIRF